MNPEHDLVFNDVPAAGYKVANFTLGWANTHLVQCSACKTIIMPTREGTHCNCGRVANSRFGIVVFDLKQYRNYTIVEV